LREVVYFLFPKNLAQFAARVSHMKWAPDHGQDSIPFLLLSDGNRLLVINPAVLSNSASGPEFQSENQPYLVADYQLGDQFGKLTYADFLLDSKYVVLMFEMGSQAPILTLDKPQREDIPDVKFNSKRTLSLSPDERSVAFLLRSKGQDQVMVMSRKDGDLEPQATFATHTSDAQGVMWSPNEDPVIAVHDSAAHGSKIFFFSALGHTLKQLDLITFDEGSDVMGLGISCLKWASWQSQTMLATGDGEKRVLVRRQDNRFMVTNSTYCKFSY
jgi:WD40 repeat protein